MTRRRITDDRKLFDKTKQMREYRERDAWMKDPIIVREIIRHCTGFRGRKLMETGLKYHIICNASKAKLRKLGWGTANVALCRELLRKIGPPAQIQFVKSLIEAANAAVGPAGSLAATDQYLEKLHAEVKKATRNTRLTKRVTT
jgi:hypothetical protein